MVYGNTGEKSGSGVAFTRNPANGNKEFYGEFLINAQGEDVVARRAHARAGGPAQEPSARPLQGDREHPRHPGEAFQGRAGLSKFTIQDGKVYMLQTRNGKRTAMAALKFSIDMVKEGAHRLADRDPPESRGPARTAPRAPFSRPRSEEGRGHRLRPARRPRRRQRQGLSQRERLRRSRPPGEKVCSPASKTSPEDLRGHDRGEGILTARGGVSSHAALVARQMGKVCVCGAAALDIDYQAKTIKVAGQVINEGDSSRSTALPARFTPARSRPPRRKSSPA